MGIEPPACKKGKKLGLPPAQRGGGSYSPPKEEWNIL